MRRLAIGLSALLATSLSAQEPKACRPLFSTSAGLTEVGAFELELGGQETRHSAGAWNRTIPAQVNFGLSSWLDVRLGWSGHNINRTEDGHRDEGFGDPLVGGQVLALRQDRAGLDLGFAYWHKVPRGSVSRGISSGEHDDTLALVLSRAAGRWAVDVNAGANWIGMGPGSRARQAFASVALTCAFADGWNATLDTYTLAASDAGPRSSAAILAVSRDVTPTLSLDAGVEVSLSGGAHRYSLNAGLVWKFAKLGGSR